MGAPTGLVSLPRRLDSNSHQRVPPTVAWRIWRLSSGQPERGGVALSEQLLCDFAIDYDVKMTYRVAILAHEGRLRRRSSRRSGEWRRPRLVTRGYETPGAVARHEQWLAVSSLLAGSQELARPERFLGRQRHGGAPRGGVPVLRGTPHASQAWRRALRARQQVVRLPALRRPPHFGGRGDQADATRMQKDSKNPHARLRYGNEETHAV